jgi:ankyrin repeat protein
VTRKSINTGRQKPGLCFAAVPLLLVALTTTGGCSREPVPPPADGRDAMSLVTAVQQGFEEKFSSMLEEGADVNVQNEWGETALSWAVARGNTEVVERLLAEGADPSLTNVLGVGPLALAVESDFVEIARLLLASGADPNAPRASGETPLMTAIRVGSSEIVQMLLAEGADADVNETKFGQTALMWATGQPQVVQMLLKAGASPAPVTKSWVVDAVNYTPIVYTLGVTGIPWNNDGQYEMPVGGESALHFAARKNDIESVRLLLDAGVEVDPRSADGTTPLLASLYHWHATGPSGRAYSFAPDTDIANLLLDRGAEAEAANLAGYTPLHAAALGLVLKDPEGASRMAFNPGLGNLPDRPRPTQPEDADDVLALVQRLLKAGADPNQPSVLKTPGPVNHVRINPCPPGSTAFHVAAAARSPQLAQLLAAHGADANRVREDGHTPFSLAVLNNDLPVVKVMVAHGADVQRRYDPLDDLSDPVLVETRRRKQQSILHIAAVQGSDWVIDYLVANGARLDAVNDLGETPLDLADAQERYRVAKENELFRGMPLSDNLDRETQTTDAFKAAIENLDDTQAPAVSFRSGITDQESPHGS